MPVEGRARVAIVEGADRMNEDAQSALLKTLEEPPAGVVDRALRRPGDRLLPTVRSRCARIRLGLVGRAGHRGDRRRPRPRRSAARRSPRTPGRRPAGARARVRARAEAVLIRAELSRVLLDLTDARAAARLAAVRAAIPRALALAARDSAGRGAAGRPRQAAGRGAAAAVPPRRRPGRRRTTGLADESPEANRDAGASRPTERRRAAEILLGLWADVARDLALVGSRRRPVGPRPGAARGAGRRRGGARARRRGALPRPGRRAPPSCSPRTSRPELVLDSLALAWPRRAPPPEGRPRGRSDTGRPATRRPRDRARPGRRVPLLRAARGRGARARRLGRQRLPTGRSAASPRVRGRDLEALLDAAPGGSAGGDRRRASARPGCRRPGRSGRSASGAAITGATDAAAKRSAADDADPWWAIPFARPRGPYVVHDGADVRRRGAARALPRAPRSRRPARGRRRARRGLPRPAEATRIYSRVLGRPSATRAAGPAAPECRRRVSQPEPEPEPRARAAAAQRDRRLTTLACACA